MRGITALSKAPEAFRTISEVAEEIDVPQHVLRFWESRFAQIRPMKRGGGRRFYRREDVDLLRGVRHLLYGEGYTIRGVQRILREQGASFVQNVWQAGAEPPPPEAPDDGEESETAAPSPIPPAIAAGAPAAGAPMAEDVRRKLGAALDDLVACHRLLAVALADESMADENEVDSDAPA
jgi:DNA-binding transcriptional MerR regulator